MLPKKPKRTQFTVNTEFVYLERDYYKTIAERAIEALKLASHQIKLKAYNFSDHTIEDILREIQASEEER